MQTIIVDITPGYRMPTIYYSQNDVGTQFAIDLRSRFGDSLPVSPTVTIQATKPSGFGFSVAADSITNGVATFTTTDEMTDEYGRFPAELKVEASGVTLFTANFFMEGEVNTHPEGTIDGQQETVIPELAQLVERVETAASSVLDMTVEAETLAAGSQATYAYDEETNTATFGIPEGEAGAGAAGVTASAYSSSKTYAVGDYVIHNSNLYRCTTAITTAESFTAAHWTQVVLADDVSDLKADLSGVINTNPYIIATPDALFNGYIGAGGTKVSNNARLSISYLIPLEAGDMIIFKGGTTVNNAMFTWFNPDLTVISDSSYAENHLIISQGAAAYFCVIFKNSNGNAISPSDFDAYFVFNKASNKTITQEHIGLKMESGGLYSGKPTWSHDEHKNKIRTAYTLQLNDLIAFTVSPTDNSFDSTKEHCIVYYYASDFTYISSSSVALISGVYTFIPPANAKYLRVMIESLSEGTAVTNKIGTMYISYYMNGMNKPKEVKNGHYHTTVEWLTFDVTDKVSTCARMLLPYNYDPLGKPSPLILYLSGSGNFTTWTANFPAAQLTKNLPYLADEGFAVLSIFAWGDQFLDTYPLCGNSYPYPLPTNRKCIKKGIEWVCDRFNIDYNNIHIMSKSQGGQLALFYASVPDFPIKSIGMFSPVLDYMSMPGDDLYADVRKAISDDAGFTGADLDYFRNAGYLGYTDRAKAILHENLPQLAGMNEAWKNLSEGTIEQNFNESFNDCKIFWTEEAWNTPSRTDIYNNYGYHKAAQIPIKIWGSSDDNQTPFFKMVEVVEQLKNGGTEAVLHELPRGTGGHSSPDVDGNYVASVTTESGTVYENISIGLPENVAWIRQHMAK